MKAGKLKVAFIGVAPYKWAQSLLDIPGTAALVRRAKGMADVVIVYMHAGAEGSSADHVPTGMETFLGEQRGDPRAFAHAMIDAGAALVLGSGPHTLRGMEWYRGHLVAYSLGNLAGSNTLSTSGKPLAVGASVGDADLDRGADRGEADPAAARRPRNARVRPVRRGGVADQDVVARGLRPGPSHRGRRDRDA